MSFRNSTDDIKENTYTVLVSSFISNTVFYNFIIQSL
jgi:hypothetical protein